MCVRRDKTNYRMLSMTPAQGSVPCVRKMITKIALPTTSRDRMTPTERPGALASAPNSLARLHDQSQMLFRTASTFRACVQSRPLTSHPYNHHAHPAKHMAPLASRDVSDLYTIAVRAPSISSRHCTRSRQKANRISAAEPPIASVSLPAPREQFYTDAGQ
jgi:hypothetical protein